MRLLSIAINSAPAKTFSFHFAVLILVLFLGGISNASAKTLPDKLLKIGGAEIEVFFAPGVADEAYAASQEEIIEWIERSAKAVVDYFHVFPVKNLNIRITDGAGARVGGTSYPGATPFITISINQAMTKEFLFDDWVMVHEMVHLSFPPLKRRHYWLLEGLATYVEPIVRVRAGIMKEDNAWRWLINGTPQGLPKAGDKGLDNTPTWGRKYWGGAVFFFLADIAIHKQTNNKFGIEHALRAIQAAGGSMQLEMDWEVSKALAIGDKATGTKVLMTLYKQMKDKPVITDLAVIWKELGVSLKGTEVVYNNAALSAKIRKSIY